MQDPVKFHTDRAMDELRLASRNPNPQAARAHLRLSGLHLDALRNLCSNPAPGPLSQTAGRDAA